MVTSASVTSWPPQGGPLSSQVAVPDVLPVHGRVLLSEGLHDPVTGLDVGLEDLCGLSVYPWGLNLIDVVL